MADDALSAVLDHLVVRSRRGDRAECLCPAHDDRNASLSVAKGTEQPVVLHCHAGCRPEDIVAKIGLSLADLTGQGQPHVVATYAYTTATGEAAYFVERWVPKSFKVVRADGVRLRPAPADELLYNLPEVAKAVANGETVYLVEGEKDVEVARQFGYVATTAMSGAGQAWLPQFTEALAGAHLVIIGDNDKRGRIRARRLYAELEPVTRSSRMAMARIGKDFADHLLAGYNIDLLDPLPATEDALVIYSLNHVASLPMTWAWPGWIPDAMLTLIEGDPGDGKSVLTVDLAARWTTGMPMPDGTVNTFGAPIRVGMVSAEDDPKRVIRPRFIAAGGNLANLIYVAGMPMGDRYLRSVDLELDVDAIRVAIETQKLRVLFLDPLMAFMGSAKTAIDNEVRKILTPLKYLAEETDCAIIAVRHLRKAGGKAVHAGGGSIAFTGQARSVLLVGRNPHDEEQRILAVTKSNVAAPPTSLAYRLASDPTMNVPYVVWEGESELRAVDLLDAGLFSSTEVRGEVAAELVRLLSIEDLPFDTIRKRVLSNGVECGEKTLRTMLKTVAEQVRTGQGTQSYKVVYRLKSNYSHVAPPQVDGSEYPLAPQGLVPSTQSEQESMVGEPSTAKEIDLPFTPKIGAEPDTGDDTDSEVNGTPLPSTAIESDEVVACSICGVTEAILYWDTIPAWRCRHHNPLTYRGEAA